MARRSERLLDCGKLVAAAFAQLEEDGLDGLSMRRVAARLDVQAPAIYWHVGNKAELLGLMVRDIYASAHDAVGAAASWPDWLIGFGLAMRDTLARRRDGARLCAVAMPPLEEDAVAAAATIVRPLTDLGLDRVEALSHQAAVTALAQGWASFQTNAPIRAFLDETFDFEHAFEMALRALVRGLRDGHRDAAGARSGEPS